MLTEASEELSNAIQAVLKAKVDIEELESENPFKFILSWPLNKLVMFSIALTDGVTPADVRQLVDYYNSCHEAEKKAQDELWWAASDLFQLQTEIKTLHDNMQSSLNPSYYMNALYAKLSNLKHVISSKTDADGKFSLNLIEGENYLLFATGERLIGAQEKEEYHWFYDIRNDDSLGVLFLSNDNLSKNLHNYESLLTKRDSYNSTINKIESSVGYRFSLPSLRSQKLTLKEGGG